MWRCCQSSVMGTHLPRWRCAVRRGRRRGRPVQGLIGAGSPVCLLSVVTGHLLFDDAGRLLGGRGMRRAREGWSRGRGTTRVPPRGRGRRSRGGSTGRSRLGAPRWRDFLRRRAKPLEGASSGHPRTRSATAGWARYRSLDHGESGALASDDHAVVPQNVHSLDDSGAGYAELLGQLPPRRQEVTRGEFTLGDAGAEVIRNLFVLQLRHGCFRVDDRLTGHVTRIAVRR